MEKLLTYLNGLPKADRQGFVERCETSEGYLRKAISKRQRLGEGLCINIDRESSGAVRCEDLRPEVDWAYLRKTPESSGAVARDCVPGGEQAAHSCGSVSLAPG